MKLTEIYLREILVKEIWGQIEESIQIDEAITGKLASLLKQADKLLFEPFGITKNDYKKYIISGSGKLYLYPLVRQALKLDQPGDLDLVVPGNVEWDYLKQYLQKNGTWEKHKDNYEKGIYRPTSDIEAFKEWNPPGVKVSSTSEIMNNSDVVDGYNFMDFKDIIDYKMKLDRPKEKEIVNLLLKYKNASEKERANIIKSILKIMRVDDKGQTRLLFPGEIGDLKDFAQAAV
jgi:hypothetical protein